MEPRDDQDFPQDLLNALEALEEAVFIDYGMRTDPLPCTAEALRRARDVIRRTRVRARHSGGPRTLVS